MSKTMDLKSEVRLRPATDEDVPFLFNSWLRCYRHSAQTRGIENPVYFAQHHLLLEGLCKRATITIACNPSDIAQIYGYIAYEEIEGLLVIHFIYMKELYRKLGIGSILAESAGFKKEAPVLFTHRTYSADFLTQKYLMVYNPYLAYYGYDLAKSEAK